MKAAKQISVAMENKRGELEHFCSALAARKVNILAMSVVGSSEQSILRMVVDRPDAVAEMLEESAHITWTTQEVVTAEVPNESGSMAELSGRLARAGVNIEYLYGSVIEKGTKSLVVMGVSNVKKALSA